MTDTHQDTERVTTAPQATARQATGTTRTPPTPPKLQLLFETTEVCELIGLSIHTLKLWIRKRWVRPAVRSTGGRGNEHQWSAWQTIGLAILSAALRAAKSAHAQLGRVGVVSAMETLAGLDDSLLLSEDEQDPHVAEEIAAEVARAASPELPCECLEAVARVVAAVDRKVRSSDRMEN